MKSTVRSSRILAVCAGMLVTVTAQIPSGGNYALPRSVVANGSGSSGSTGGGVNFMVDGIIGQSAAGVLSANGPYSVTGGFSQNSLAPTAAGVSVSGRVVTSDGRPISRVLVALADANGNIRTALSNIFGLFHFDGIEAGQTYIISAESKRFTFAPRIVSVGDEITNLDITALP